MCPHYPYIYVESTNFMMYHMHVSPIVHKSGQMLAEEQGRWVYHTAQCCTPDSHPSTEGYILSELEHTSENFLTPILMP